MTCAFVDEHILRNSLESVDRAAIARHIRTCQGCAKKWPLDPTPASFARAGISHSSNENIATLLQRSLIIRQPPNAHNHLHPIVTLPLRITL